MRFIGRCRKTPRSVMSSGSVAQVSTMPVNSIGAKKEWPSWTPTPGMLRREPEDYSRWRDGMPGGLNNPLGSRALYLFPPGRGDTFLRIHGTNDPSTLARRVSNGCARLVNDQMIDLYDRVPIDTRVVLHPNVV
jgi:lipoprotein-anchoring transpeptidase ErfK/SrfK